MRLRYRTAAVASAISVLVVVFTVPVGIANGSEHIDHKTHHADEATQVIAIQTSTPQSQSDGSCGPGFAEPLEARVLDSSGQPVSGIQVTFAAPSAIANSGPPSAEIPTCSNEYSTVATTDASGIAYSPSLAPDGVAGSYQVTATVVGVSNPAIFNLTNTAGAPLSVTAVPTTTPQSAKIRSAFQRPLQALVESSSGDPMSGIPVTFQILNATDSGNYGGASATFSGHVISDVVDTNVMGVASAPSLTANGVVGNFVVVAFAPDGLKPAVFDVSNLQSAPYELIAIPASTPQAQFDNSCGPSFAEPLEARVLDSTGHPVSGVRVRFQAPIGVANSGPPSSEIPTCSNRYSASAITDANGIAFSPGIAPDGAAGSYEVTASAVGVSVPAIFSLTNTATAPVQSVVQKASTHQVAITLRRYAQRLQLKLTESSSPLGGVPVTFVIFDATNSGYFGGASATFTGKKTSVIANTNAQGIATSPTVTANAKPGEFIVTATTPDGLRPAVFILTNE